MSNSLIYAKYAKLSLGKVPPGGGFEEDFLGGPGESVGVYENGHVHGRDHTMCYRSGPFFGNVTFP